eukprot:GGOE01009118.1.p1 GENE.GGOE01009118.1~~GGOE01009118.1.p1  ORF type:complete len:480 (-),score=79.72 GGOE01009118.1:964-2370(-)
MAPSSPLAAESATEVAPARYFCPITTEIMVDPVMDRHGHNFERAAILDWLCRNAECPMSRCPIHAADLFPNLALKEDIANWLADHPGCPEGPPTSLPLPTEPAIEVQATPSEPDAPPDVLVTPPVLGVVVDLPTSVEHQRRQQHPLQQEGEEETEAKPWLRLNVPQEEYDMLATLFYSFCAPSETLSHVDAQQLLRYMNYHEAVGALDALEETVSLPRFVTFAAAHRPQPADYGLSPRKYQSIVQCFRELDVAGRGTLDRAGIRALCDVLNVEEPPSLPEGPNAQLTCHDFLLRLKDPHVATVAPDGVPDDAAAVRRRVTSIPIAKCSRRAQQRDAASPQQSPLSARTLHSPTFHLALSPRLPLNPSPGPGSPSLKRASQSCVINRRISDGYTFPIRGPKSSPPSARQSMTPRLTPRRSASDLSSMRSLSSLPVSPLLSSRSVPLGLSLPPSPLSPPLNSRSAPTAGV